MREDEEISGIERVASARRRDDEIRGGEEEIERDERERTAVS